MKVLVTGHLGYIGTVMVPMLVKAGHAVKGCDSDLYARCTYEPGGIISSVPNIGKDVRDVAVRDLYGFDAVIHLAALSNDPLGELNPEVTYAINHRASVRTRFSGEEGRRQALPLCVLVQQLRRRRR